MIVLCVALTKDLRSDPQVKRDAKAVEVVERAVITGSAKYDGEFQLQLTPSNGFRPDGPDDRHGKAARTAAGGKDHD